MKNNRLQTLLMAVGILAATLTHAATAEGLATQQEGLLRVAVYKDFPPYADAGKGVDVALGRLGQRREVLDEVLLERRGRLARQLLVQDQIFAPWAP